MSVETILERLLNPAVIGTMVASGIAYGMFLWSLNLRPTILLFLVAVVPGTIYLLVLWAIRGFQGTLSLVYLAELILWWIFAISGFITVMVRRRYLGRPQKG